MEYIGTFQLEGVQGIKEKNFNISRGKSGGRLVVMWL